MEQINELATALSKFQGKMKVVEFDSSNPYFKSKYASLTALIKSASPILSECGLAVSQLLGEGGAVTTILMHTSGQALSSTIKLNPTKEDPQGIGSAITYARRYSYASILGLVSDEDDDANSASKTNGVVDRVAKTPIVENKPYSVPNRGKEPEVSKPDILTQTLESLAKKVFKTKGDFIIWKNSAERINSPQHILIDELQMMLENDLEKEAGDE